jgi:hypothetical protein
MGRFKSGAGTPGLPIHGEAGDDSMMLKISGNHSDICLFFNPKSKIQNWTGR